MTGLGFLAGLGGLYVFISLLPVWATHIVAIGCILGAVIIIVRSQRRQLRSLGSPNGGFDAFDAFIAGWTGSFGLAVAASVAMAFLVAQRAGEAAGDAPYCLQVADKGKGDYRRATSLLDLSALTMWAKRESGMFMQHHAILVVGNEVSPRLLHWSYRNREFVAGIINERTPGYGPSLTCGPKLNFAGDLPVLFPRSRDSELVRFSAQEAYRIPKAYRPQWSGGSGRYLRLATTAPEFRPLNRTAVSLAAGGFSDWLFIQWNPDWFLSLLKLPQGHQDVAQGTEFGLHKTLAVSYGRNSERYESYRYLAYADEQTTGVNTTLIVCSPASERFPASCQHRFLNNGRHFDFRHRLEDLPNWQVMQNRLLSLFASFEKDVNLQSDRW